MQCISFNICPSYGWTRRLTCHLSTALNLLCSAVFSSIFSNGIDRRSLGSGSGSVSAASHPTLRQQRESPAKPTLRESGFGAGGGGAALPHHATCAPDTGQLLHAMNCISR
jgi:hypothetical protein